MAGCTVAGDDVTEGQDTAALGAITSSSAFTISISTETAPQDKVTVSSSDGTPTRDCFGGCTFAYLAGATLTLRIPFPIDRTNCIQFSGWSGACSGQGNPCVVVLNSDLSTEANWSTIIGCQPK
ncbi:MAG TPA: hypothetical protein VFK02_04180 [Kofleriaceae bacterium]|nr:hypothetical protein [Kofleriaceae bacterium]